MISIYKIKPKFQNLLRPILVYLYKLNVTANQITLASIVLSLMIGITFWYADRSRWLFLVLPLGLLIRMALNALDGMMAREYNQQSQKGEVLNEVGDVFSDVFIFFPLLKYEQESLYLVTLCILLSVINEFSGLIGKVVGGARRYDGPMGKSDRAFVLAIYGIVSFIWGVGLSYLNWAVLIVLILLVMSTYTRLNKSIG